MTDDSGFKDGLWSVVKITFGCGFFLGVVCCGIIVAIISAWR